MMRGPRVPEIVLFWFRCVAIRFAMSGCVCDHISSIVFSGYIGSVPFYFILFLCQPSSLIRVMQLDVWHFVFPLDLFAQILITPR